MCNIAVIEFFIDNIKPEEFNLVKVFLNELRLVE